MSPFKSERQRRYLWAKVPRVAKAWAHGRHTSTRRRRGK